MVRADSLLTIGNADSAALLYQSVSALQPTNLHALIGFGKSSLGVRDWDRAVEIAAQIHEIDPQSLPGHYIEAVARREKGRFAYRESGHHGPSITGDWGRARRLFALISSRDSSFEDVLYQFALLNRLEGTKDDANALVSRELALRPSLIGPAIGRYRLFEYWIGTEDSGEIVKWLEGLPGTLPRYYVGEVCRRHGDFNGADSIFESLLFQRGEVSPQAVRLSLARLRMQQGDETAAENEYWKAISEIADPLGAAILFEDLKYIISDQELYLFNSLDSVIQKRDFFRTFWNFRNPSLALKINQRLREHIKRYVIAEQKYEFYGARTRFNDPDRIKQLRFPNVSSLNEKFNDMGLIFLRHGPPDDVVRKESSQSAADTLDDPRMEMLKKKTERRLHPDAFTYEDRKSLQEMRQRYKDNNSLSGGDDSFESWLYDATRESPRMIFHFQKHLAVGNNWRLTPLPDNDPMLSELAGWDAAYYRMYWGRDDDRASLQAQITADARLAVRHALSTEHETPEKKIEAFYFPYAIDVFRAPGGKCLLDISYGIPLASISRSLPDTVRTVPVEVGFSLVDARSQHGTSELDTVDLDISHSRTGMILDLIRYTVPPDSYAVAMHMRPLIGEKLATWERTIRAPNFSGPGFMISSIQLLRPSTVKGALDIDGMRVVQSPLSTYKRTETLFVYFQMYHLVPDIDGETSWRTECILQPQGDSDPVKGVQVYVEDKTGKEETAAQFCQIDVRNIPPRRYQLIVKATDRKRVETVIAQRDIEIVNP